MGVSIAILDSHFSMGVSIAMPDNNECLNYQWLGCCTGADGLYPESGMGVLIRRGWISLSWGGCLDWGLSFSQLFTQGADGSLIVVFAKDGGAGYEGIGTGSC